MPPVLPATPGVTLLLGNLFKNLFLYEKQKGLELASYVL